MVIFCYHIFICDIIETFVAGVVSRVVHAVLLVLVVFISK